MKHTELKRLFTILLSFLMIVSLLSGCRKKKEEPVEEASADDTTEEEAPNSGVTIIENEGEITIEIPEDMDSDGF